MEHQVSNFKDSLFHDLQTSYQLEFSAQKINIISIDRHNNHVIYALIPPHYKLSSTTFCGKSMSSPQMEDDIEFAIGYNLQYTLDVLKFCHPAFRSVAEQ